MTNWLIALAVAYLVGSIPFGVIIGRMRGIDIREHGSRNIGATNVGRVLGRRLGLLCFVLDLMKGAGPVLTIGAVQRVLGRSSFQCDFSGIVTFGNDAHELVVTNDQ